MCPILSKEFKDLVYYGDEALKNLCEGLVQERWGTSHRLVNLLLDDWLSNNNWLFWGVVYGLGGMVRGHMVPVVSTTAKQNEPHTNTNNTTTDPVPLHRHV